MIWTGTVEDSMQIDLIHVNEIFHNFFVIFFNILHFFKWSKKYTNNSFFFIPDDSVDYWSKKNWRQLLLSVVISTVDGKAKIEY